MTNQSACANKGIVFALINIIALASLIDSFVPIITNASVITDSVITRAVLLAVEITN